MRLINRLFYAEIAWMNTIDLTLLVYRVLISLILILVHGFPKAFHFNDTAANIPDPFGLGGHITAMIAVSTDLVCPVLIAIGLLTRVSTIFILSVTLTGLFIVHAYDPWAIKETPYIYSVSFLLLLFLGPGKYSVDGLLQKKWSVRTS